MLPAWRELRTGTARCGLKGSECAVSWNRCHLPKRWTSPRIDLFWTALSGHARLREVGLETGHYRELDGY
jgi:hypothetical protein